MIEEGMYVVVQKLGGEHTRVCKLAKKQSILVEKLKFNVDGAIGCPFGLFDVRDGNLTPASTLALNQEESVETGSFFSKCVHLKVLKLYQIFNSVYFSSYNIIVHHVNW